MHGDVQNAKTRRTSMRVLYQVEMILKNDQSARKSRPVRRLFKRGATI